MGCRGSEVRILSPRPYLPDARPARASPFGKRQMSQSPFTDSAAPWQAQPFRRMVEGGADYAIFLLDPDGRIASWNRGAALIHGYAAAEAVGRHFSMLHPQSAVARGWPEHELDTARRLGRFED